MMMSDYERQGPACDSGASSHFMPLTHTFKRLMIPGTIIKEEVHVEVASGHSLVSYQSALFALKSPDPRCKGESTPPLICEASPYDKRP